MYFAYNYVKYTLVFASNFYKQIFVACLLFFFTYNLFHHNLDNNLLDSFYKFKFKNYWLGKCIMLTEFIHININKFL